MRTKLLSIAALGFLFPLAAFGGGILTNSNQSASYIRMPARDASITADALYYNPAGLIKLDSGFHFSLNGQYIYQDRKIQNDYPFLNNGTYKGTVKVPCLPSIYAIYKTGKWAFSAGFIATAGGGYAKYDKGLPSFEMNIASIPAMLSASGISTSKYSVDISFKGGMVFYGYQAGATYEINKTVSVYGGLRYVQAQNTYKGSIRNIQINPSAPYGTGNLMPAPAFFSGMANQLGDVVNNLTPLITSGAGNLTLNQLVSLGYMSSTQAASLQAGLGSSYNSSMTVSQIQSAYQLSQTTMAATATATSDKEVDAKQTGHGFTPIFGVNINTPDEKLNVGIRYEFRTKLELTNDTKIDNTEMFRNGAKTRSDLPAILSVGAGYKVLPDMKVSLGWHHYFDKDANWDGKENKVNHNLNEYAAGIEYNVSPRLMLSAGYLFAQTGVSHAYQSDMTYILSSNTYGFGGCFKATSKMDVNVGVMYSKDIENHRTYDFNSIRVKETYNRYEWLYALGIDYHL
jgi:long-subunit fatty acid transport protein